MAEVVEIASFVKGKKTRRGRPLPTDEMPRSELVTAVAPAAIDRFLGARDATERTRHLRRLRDEGILIHNRGRLTQKVRGHGIPSAYVFRGSIDGVPRIRDRSSATRVIVL